MLLESSLRLYLLIHRINSTKIFTNDSCRCISCTVYCLFFVPFQAYRHSYPEAFKGCKATPVVVLLNSVLQGADLDIDQLRILSKVPLVKTALKFQSTMLGSVVHTKNFPRILKIYYSPLSNDFIRKSRQMLGHIKLLLSN